ncbi:hypothetical protein KSP39_PZI000580 [Platanthera zijinensis]|uniref:Uncharacterized protein n=1 Tax=Platanthera zijinensis TaxID=2320716 RepID=A0AAP0C1W0_9ASPA
MIPSLFLSAPFSLISLTYWACARTASLAIQAWWELLMAILGFFLDLTYKSMVWALALLTLPLRLLTALYREIKLEQQLSQMKAQLESLACENMELGQCLQVAVKETSIVEKIFQDIEDDYEKAIAKISLLQNEIQDLKALGKAPWDDDKTASITPWSGKHIEGGATLRDDVMIRRGDVGGREERGPFRGSDEEHKAVAVRRSLFSAALSIMVGLTIWEAEEPCMPLVAALLTVVGMSMGTVVNFFLAIKNKPASDAVVLLTINCFMLGALSRPALPRVAHAWAQCVLRAASWCFCRLGFSS